MKKGTIIISVTSLIYLQLGCNNDSIKQNKSTSVDTTIHNEIVLQNKSWTINSFVDDFGESGKDKYLQTKAQGDFSNSATASAHLGIEMLMTLKNAAFFLHEYRDISPSAKFIGTGKIRMKNEDDKDITIYSYSSWNEKGGLLIDDDNYKKLREFMLNSKGVIKVVIFDDYSSVYSFSIDLSNFVESYNILKDAASVKK